MDVGVWIFIRWMLDFDCLGVEFWLCGRLILVVRMLDSGCVDVGFWLSGR